MNIQTNKHNNTTQLKTMPPPRRHSLCKQQRSTAEVFSINDTITAYS